MRRSYRAALAAAACLLALALLVPATGQAAREKNIRVRDAYKVIDTKGLSKGLKKQMRALITRWGRTTLKNSRTVETNRNGHQVFRGKTRAGGEIFITVTPNSVTLGSDTLDTSTGKLEARGVLAIRGNNGKAVGVATQKFIDPGSGPFTESCTVTSLVKKQPKLFGNRLSRTIRLNNGGTIGDLIGAQERGGLAAVKRALTNAIVKDPALSVGFDPMYLPKPFRP